MPFALLLSIFLSVLSHAAPTAQECAQALAASANKLDLNLETAARQAIARGDNLEQMYFTGIVRTNGVNTEADLVALFGAGNVLVRAKIAQDFWTFQANFWGALTAASSDQLLSMQMSKRLQTLDTVN